MISSKWSNYPLRYFSQMSIYEKLDDIVLNIFQEWLAREFRVFIIEYHYYNISNFLLCNIHHIFFVLHSEINRVILFGFP